VPNIFVSPFVCCNTPLLLVVDSRRVHDMLVGPDDLSSNYALIVLSSEAPVELFPLKSPSSTTRVKCSLGGLNQYSSSICDYQIILVTVS
jgi:hypothetical protein